MRIIDMYKAAAQESGRSVFSLILEAARLRTALGQMGFTEYIDFRLYMNDLSFSQKAEFGGFRAQRVLEEILIDDQSRFISSDKVTMYSLFRGYGLPTPKFRAIYRCQRPSSLLNIGTAAELADYLRVPANLPVYLKPSFGAYGRGNTLVTKLNGDCLELGDGSSVQIDEFCSSIDDGRSLGWILQEPLTSHEKIAEICGSKISGVRLHTFMTPSGPELFKAIFKINSGHRDSDNFHHGTSGNMAAVVNLETGKLERVVSRPGLGQQLLQNHPRTGIKLIGFQVPHWEEIKKLVLEAHTAFPGFICPGWDIAVCSDGPRILEVNTFGDIDLPQNTYHLGFMDKRFMGLMDSRGLGKVMSGKPGSNIRSLKNGRLGLRAHHWNW